ncbi:MAG: threonine synthase [Thermomicrobiales bacterium]|nr:threonine synthase [Thermomicrobiales bacterium]
MSILPGWSLACPSCGFTTTPGLYPRGCPACHDRGEISGLVITYDQPGTLPPVARTGEGIWKAASLLPAIAPELRLTLGEGDTPLVQVPALSELSGCERLFLKMETQNPTAAHKDRLHAVSVAVGKALGCTGVFSSSTGNHGFSMASYAAAHGMRAVVIANERMPVLLQRAIRFAGGLPLFVPPELDEEITIALAEQDGWYPAETSWPMPVANPFGVEGYKTIGYELYHQIGGRMPDLVFFPSAGGDGLVALWRAIADLRRIGLPNVDARVCPCQPAGAAPIVAALEQGLDAVPYLPNAYSRALSIGDPTGGWLALRAVRETGGFGVAVSDEAILATGRLLARNGLLVEPSSAASVAGALQALRDRPDLRDQTIVCVVTSSGLKWLDHYEDGPPLDGALPVDSVDAARAAVEDYERDFGA